MRDSYTGCVRIWKNGEVIEECNFSCRETLRALKERFLLNVTPLAKKDEYQISIIHNFEYSIPLNDKGIRYFKQKEKSNKNAPKTKTYRTGNKNNQRQ